MISVYLEERGLSFKVQDLRNAFNAYSNLVQNELCFICEICGDNPKVLIFDGNAKLRSSVDFVRDVDKTIEPEFNGEVSLTDFWENSQLLAILRMFGITDSRLNFKMAPIMDSGLANSVVLNTEYMKLNKAKDVQQSGHRELSTDQIREFCLTKMRNSELRAACEGYGLKTLPRESNEDLRSRILD